MHEMPTTAIPNKGQAGQSRVWYFIARPHARTLHRTDSLESYKKILLLGGGLAQLWKKES